MRSADALILRLKAADTARQVLRTAHQLLGALGFCDESDVSVLDRHTQSLIRLPVSTEVLAMRLTARYPRRRVRDVVLGTGIGVSTQAAVAAEEAPANPLGEGIPFGTKLAAARRTAT